MFGSALYLAGGSGVSAYTLEKRARWRSFGVNDWLFNDPFERSQRGTDPLPYTSWKIPVGQNQTDKLLSLIGFAEAGRLQYDAVHMSARRRPGKYPTEMQLSEILHWIRKTPGQHHAIGRYQFIPSTLVMLARRAGVPTSRRFGPKLQDSLAYLLLLDAGYDDFLDGRIALDRFMDNLAWIWAGLPLRNGRSAYSGVAGNRATISRRFYTAQMQSIFT